MQNTQPVPVPVQGLTFGQVQQIPQISVTQGQKKPRKKKQPVPISTDYIPPTPESRVYCPHCGKSNLAKEPSDRKPSAYNQFVKHEMQNDPEIKALPVGERLKKIGEKWKSIPAEEKQYRPQVYGLTQSMRGLSLQPQLGPLTSFSLQNPLGPYTPQIQFPHQFQPQPQTQFQPQPQVIQQPVTVS